MKLGELATVRSGLVLSRKQARKGTPVKMRYPLLSFRAIHPNGYIDMEQLDGFDAAEQLSPEYLPQIGDVIIYPPDLAVHRCSHRRSIRRHGRFIKLRHHPC